MTDPFSKTTTATITATKLVVIIVCMINKLNNSLKNKLKLPPKGECIQQLNKIVRVDMW